jgi:hypothetical protein
MLGLLCASFVMEFVYSGVFGDLPNQSTMWTVSFYTLSASFLGTIISGQIRQRKMQRMIDNYNIFIMGIPIDF